MKHKAEGECANCGAGVEGRRSKRVRINPVPGIPPVRVTEALCFACGSDYDHEERWRIKQMDAAYRGEPQ